MKKKIYLYVALLLGLWLSTTSVLSAQNYIRLDDASGMDTDAYQMQLQAAADSLLSLKNQLT